MLCLLKERQEKDGEAGRLSHLKRRMVSTLFWFWNRKFSYLQLHVILHVPHTSGWFPCALCLLSQDGATVCFQVCQHLGTIGGFFTLGEKKVHLDIWEAILKRVGVCYGPIPGPIIVTTFTQINQTFLSIELARIQCTMYPCTKQVSTWS